MSSVGSVAKSFDDSRAEAGFVSAQFLVAVALSLLLLAAMSNVLVQRYALAAVQTALDEAVRAGGLQGATGLDCATRARQTVQSLLGGSYGQRVQLGCTRQGQNVHAWAQVDFPGWGPMVPTLATQLQADAVAEP